MELHLALRSIIDSEGINITKELRLVNILDDLKAFDSISASRYMLRALVVDGYTNKILSIGAWNPHMEKLCYNFASNTGFKIDLVYYIFQSFVFGLHFIDKIEKSGIGPISNDVPLQLNVPDPSKLIYGYEEVCKRGDRYEKQYKEDCEIYIDSIIEMKGDWNTLGARFTPSCVYSIYLNTSHLAFFLEIDGIIKRSGRESLRVHVVIYNQNGRVIDKTYTYIEKRKFKNSYQVVEIGHFNEFDFKFIGNIRKAIIYWDVY